MSRADEINLGEVISGVVLFTEPTQNQYAVWLRRLATFLSVPTLNATGLIPKQFMTDNNLAKFIYHMGQTYGQKIHTLKALSASLNSAFVTHSIRGFREFPHLFPNSRASLPAVPPQFRPTFSSSQGALLQDLVFSTMTAALRAAARNTRTNHRKWNSPTRSK